MQDSFCAPAFPLAILFHSMDTARFLLQPYHASAPKQEFVEAESWSVSALLLPLRLTTSQCLRLLPS